jgi:predicted RNA binding protein YcfA (HicA-like mRNA interferase family)
MRSFLHTFLREEAKMKRKHLIKKLAEAGFTFQDGGRHTKAYDAQGTMRATIPRHTELNEKLVDAIQRQSGVRLR